MHVLRVIRSALKYLKRLEPSLGIYKWGKVFLDIQISDIQKWAYVLEIEGGDGGMMMATVVLFLSCLPFKLRYPSQQLQLCLAAKPQGLRPEEILFSQAPSLSKLLRDLL